MRRGVSFATKSGSWRRSPLSLRAGNVAVRTQRVPLPLSLPLTKTFSRTLLCLVPPAGCCARPQTRCGASAPPRDRTPVVVAACGDEAAPPAASSDSSRSSTGVTGYVTGLRRDFAKVNHGFCTPPRKRFLLVLCPARSHRARRASLKGSPQPPLQRQRAAAATGPRRQGGPPTWRRA